MRSILFDNSHSARGRRASRGNFAQAAQVVRSIMTCCSPLYRKLYSQRACSGCPPSTNAVCLLL